MQNKFKPRDLLASSDFAVSSKRALPIQDAAHTKMAWNALTKAQGLTDDERMSARNKIIRRANKFDVDMAGWNVSDEEMQAALSEEDEQCAETESTEHCVRFDAMAVSVPEELASHPNQAFFSGVLTKLDEPSDAAPVSSRTDTKPRRVILPKIVAEKALSSLLLMAIDFRDDLSGHDPTQKIGIITEANIVGNEIQIKGFFYSADFPDEVKRIQAQKTQLGFSYEAKVAFRQLNDDFSLITECVFTGAAVLYKSKAAYQTTSISAQNADGEKMDPKFLEQLEKITARLEKIEASASASSSANTSLYSMVKPHVDSLLSAAKSLSESGMGEGHVSAIKSVANHLLSEALSGRMPSSFESNPSATVSASAVSDKEIKTLTEKLESVSAELADLKKAKFHASGEPTRVTEPTVPGAGTVISKVIPGAGEHKSTEELFSKFYAEAEAEGETSPDIKASKALAKIAKYRAENQRRSA
jgi:hypothetical protein